MAVNSLSQLVDFFLSLSQVFSLSCVTKFTLIDFGTHFFTIIRIGGAVRLGFQLFHFNRGRIDGCVGAHYSSFSECAVLMCRQTGALNKNVRM